jgi:hypothetical protein
MRLRSLKLKERLVRSVFFLQKDDTTEGMSKIKILFFFTICLILIFVMPGFLMVIEAHNIIPTFLMSFIMSTKLFMKQLHLIILK